MNKHKKINDSQEDIEKNVNVIGVLKKILRVLHYILEYIHYGIGIGIGVGIGLILAHYGVGTW